jgi:hypothetical protein
MKTTRISHSQTKNCEHCGKVISKDSHKGRKMHAHEWAQRRYCSVKCFMNHVKTNPTKLCENCGKAFERSRYNGRLENLRNFERRRFCSRKCFGEKTTRTALVAITGPYRQHLKAECEACGQAGRLTGHHVDHNHTNNSPDNIQTLCIHCHGFWHGLQVRLGKETLGRMPRLLA